MRPRCGNEAPAASGTGEAPGSASLLALGLRAFALPLALFCVAAGALAHWDALRDWTALVAFGAALLCGWRASRALHIHGAAAQTRGTE